MVYWVLGTIFETVINLGHLARRFVTGKDARKEERAYDGDPSRVDEDFVVAASAGDLRQCQTLSIYFIPENQLPPAVLLSAVHSS